MRIRIDVSMTFDGQRVAIGAKEASSDPGYARVYELSAGTWVQLGQDIFGEAPADESGCSVVINHVGSKIAIGARRNDAGSTETFSYDTGFGDKGHVRVYQWETSTWVQRGEDIDGEAAGDLSGHTLAWDNLGTRLIVGAYKNNGADFLGDNVGHARVFQENLVL